MPAQEARKFIAKEVKRIVVKIGSAVLTQAENFLPDLNVFSMIARQVAKLHDEGRQVVIVSSGSIACGLEKMGLHKMPTDIPTAQAAAAVGQVTLMENYERAFIHQGKNVAQILFTADDMNNVNRYFNARNAINRLLEMGLIPIINENDTVATEEIKFGDNDTLGVLVTRLVEAELMVILSTIEGLYTTDPIDDPEATFIPIVYPDEDAQIYAKGTNSPVGRGGMMSKIEAAQRACRSGVPTIISKGKDDSVLLRIMEGEDVGTLFVPKVDRLESRRKWLINEMQSKAVITVTEHGCHRLIGKDGALKAKDILDVEGSFDIAELVSILDISGREIARGMSCVESSDVFPGKSVVDGEAEVVNVGEMILLMEEM
jgi:glutamate 5-kinase